MSGATARARLTLPRLGTGVYLGLLLLGLFVLMGLVGPLLCKRPPTLHDADHLLNGPSLQHLLGTDENGCDLLTQLCFGARVLLGMCLSVVTLCLTVGVLIGTVAGYRSQFQAVFASEPTAENIPRALAAFLRTLNSGDSPWDRYLAGDPAAVSAAAIAGHELFIGKAGCASCHTPPLYTDNRFHNIGLEAGKSQPDPGRQAISKETQDLHAFKTPTLRSVAISGPYFHDGSVASLEQAVRYMAAGGGAGAAKSSLLVDRKLSDPEIAQLVAFLNSLTSEEVFTPPQLL